MYWNGKISTKTIAIKKVIKQPDLIFMKMRDINTATCKHMYVYTQKKFGKDTPRFPLIGYLNKQMVKNSSPKGTTASIGKNEA